MKITAFTAHCDRPEAWELCQKYMARQTRQPDQWLVIDSSPKPSVLTVPCEYHHKPDMEKMSDKVLWAIKESLIQGDYIVWWENDDWYSHLWLAWVEYHLDKGFDVVGQGNALYYHAGRRWWSECHNVRHASLCQTGIRRNMLEPLANVIEGFDNQFFDTRLWRIERRRHLHLPNDKERLVIGMKGLAGTVGYSHEHAQKLPPGVNIDPSLMRLWQLIGDDAEAYAKFLHQ